MSDTLKEARARVRNALGAELERKASDAFCLAYTRSSPALETLEAAPRAPQMVRAVVEMAPEPLPSLAIREAATRARENPAVGDALEHVRSTLREGRREGLPRGSAMQINATAMLREMYVREMRERCFRAVHPIRDELERNVSSLFAARSEALGAAGSPARPTHVCWLNQTVRAVTSPRTLAGIAGDPRVAQVDLPRRLEREVRATGRTVGAVRFREDTGHTGEGIIIAVIDSEVARSHAAFQERVVHKQNYTPEPWGNPDSHGTAVAGIAAANGDGLVGIAPGATIYNYKVLATNPLFDAEEFFGFLALQQALEDGAHVANCSWGAGPAGDGTSREARACDAAWALGLAVVKSAGNKGPDGSTLTTPADADGVIVVGATDQAGRVVQDYSSRGPTAHAPGRIRPHLLAPGGTDARGIDSCLAGGGFGDCGSGTSFAAPHVAGLLALLLDARSDLTPDELRDQLLDACTALAGVEENAQGRGLVSVEALAGALV